ncbi:MAG: hypothetical protein ACKO34_04085 [Vampirovibrionales bacterium]
MLYYPEGLEPELRSSEGSTGVKGQSPLHAGGSPRGTLVQESPLGTRQLKDTTTKFSKAV